jgi:UDP:flavonoid glycosyltransferase YjiC (YdhE family)
VPSCTTVAREQPPRACGPEFANLVRWSGLDQPVWETSVTHLEVGLGRRFSEPTLDSLTADLRLVLTADLRLVLTPAYAIRAKAIARQMISPDASLARAADLIEEAAAYRRQD